MTTYKRGPIVDYQLNTNCYYGSLICNLLMIYLSRLCPLGIMTILFFMEHCLQTSVYKKSGDGESLEMKCRDGLTFSVF